MSVKKIAKQDWYYWRLVATGISFFAFGVGGLLLRVFVFPCLYFLPLRPAKRVMCCRYLVHWAFRQFIRIMKGLGVLTYEVHGIERLNRPGQLVIANHPSLIDVVFLIAFMRHTNCVVKGPLFRNPFTRGPVAAAGYISNDDSEQMIDDCVSSLRKQDSLVIFPEGTRTKPTHPLKFLRGAAYIALLAKPIITPVHIDSNPPTLGKHEKWYHIPHKRVHFTFDVGEDLPLDLFDNDAPATLQARHLTQSWQHYFAIERTNVGA